MFREFLFSANSNIGQINVEWIKKLNGLVRTIILDSDGNKGFVTVYYEKINKYSAIAFNATTGEIFWIKNVANGGYGAPVISENAFILPTKFTNVIALSKEDGTELWQIETQSRLRSPLNIVNNKIYFSSGCIIYESTITGYLTNQWQIEGVFFYGSVDVFNELIISLGTIEDKNGDSEIRAFVFHKKGELAYSLPISKSSIITQEKPCYSGAAIGAGIKKFYKDNATQADIREMVDSSLNLSDYEPFQIWRIILRRVLTSSANKKGELSEFNKNWE